MEKHGRARWRQIKHGLDRGVSCPKLKSYWHFHDCRYDKVSRTCAEPDHIRRCPFTRNWNELQLPAGQLGLSLHSLEIRNAGELDKAFEIATRARADALA